MVKEFNLSDKRIIITAGIYIGKPAYLEENIKESVKRLKRGNKMVSYPEDKRDYRKGWDDCVDRIIIKINKIFGDKLI